METKRIVLSGSGGQGVITAAIILGEAAAIHEGLNAVQTQAYGPEARGGATRSDVIISEKPIHYPKVINPNFLICLTQEAYNKYSGLIRPGGLLLTDSFFTKKEKPIDARQLELAMYESVMDKIGNPIVFNICVLGAFVSLTQIVSPESIIKVIATKVPSELLDTNKQAFKLGHRLGNKTKRKK